jgi:gamma-glutamyltranspeptidase/glutathione hydrolase
VPGTIAGIFAVHEKWALAISEILKPVIALAERGVIVTKTRRRPNTMKF